MACRVWDVFCRDGEESLFRTGLGILRLFEDILLQMDFIHIAQFLTRLPEDLQSHTLFAAMANTHMISRNRRWAQVSGAHMAVTAVASQRPKVKWCFSPSGVFCVDEGWEQRDGQERQPSLEKLTLAKLNANPLHASASC